MKCDFCHKDCQYYAYPSLCMHRFCMSCLMNEVFCEVKCPFCSQHLQSIVHNLTQDENLVVLSLREPNIKRFLSNMFLVMGMESGEVDQKLLEANNKLFFEETESEETEELTDFNITDD